MRLTCGNECIPDFWRRAARCALRSARSVGFCNFAWTQSVETVHTIKRELGYYIEGTRASLPTAQYKGALLLYFLSPDLGLLTPTPL